MHLMNLRALSFLKKLPVSYLSSTIFKCGVPYQMGLVNVRQSSEWTFRSNYEKNPVTDPSKLKNSYSNYYYHDLHIRNTVSVKYFAFLFVVFILAMLDKPRELVLKLEQYFGSPDAKHRSENLEKLLPDEPEKAKKFFARAKASTELLITEQIESDEDDDGDKAPKKSRVGFRDSRIIAYEDRIRSYSTPDKIFRYFATIQDFNGEVYMTPQDFVRSITPGVRQPEGLGLDSFRKIDIRKEKIPMEIKEDSVFYLFGENALINFSDYVFLLTVISTPQRQFEIAFRMFDLNGDGELDVEEFDVVRSIIKSGSAMGKRHRDNSVTGNTLNNLINSSLSKYFFGVNGKRKLTIKDFTTFQHRLQKEIMRLEFDRYNPEDGMINEVDFADSLLMYAEFPENKKKKFLRRVRQKYNDTNSIGISFEEYFAFSKLLRSISDVDTALTFYHLAGASIDQQTLKHVSKAVANVDINDHMIDIVFTLFDTDNDGSLSNKEFVLVMKQKLLRGLDRPMDTGFVRLLNALSKCTKEAILSDPFG